jgi:hypothetical protein
MSYILQALKQSDRERRRGMVPDLFAEHESRTPSARKPRWPYLLITALLINALVLLLWRIPSPSQPPEQNPIPAAAVSDPPLPTAHGSNTDRVTMYIDLPILKQRSSGPRNQPQVEQKDLEPTDNVARTRPEQTTSEAIAKPSSIPRPHSDGSSTGTTLTLNGKQASAEAHEDHKGSNLDGPTQNIEARDATATGGTQPRPTQPSPAPEPTSLGALRQELELLSKSSQTTSGLAQQPAIGSQHESIPSPEFEALAKSPQPDPAIGPDRISPSTVDPAGPAEQDTAPQVMPRVTSLPPTVQDKLPELSFSVHTYAANPKARMIRINGTMMREGQTLDNGIKIVEITREGVLLEFQGHRFHMQVTERWRAR